MNLVVYPEGSDYFIPDTQADTAVMLAGEKSDKYMKAFAEGEKKKFKLSWNTCSFLFTGFWFIYRKMFSQGIAVLLAFAFLISSIAFFPGLRWLSIPVLLILWIGCGLCGNGIYMENLRKTADAALEIPQNLRLEYIFKVGGTDKKATIISAVIAAVITVGFVFLAKAVI